MTDDELYEKYLLIRYQIKTELCKNQDEKLLHYQTLLQLNYVYAGSKNLKHDDICNGISYLEERLKKYKIQ